MKRHPRRHDLPPEHVKHALFRAAIDALTRNGWTVTRVPEARGTSVRRIEKVGPKGKTISHIVSIRTSQNGSLAFTRDRTETFWIGLSDAKLVLVACVDHFKQPNAAILHLYPAPRLKDIYSRKYAKSKKAGVKLKPETGYFIALNELPALTNPKYFGEDGILARAEPFMTLNKYIQVDGGSLRSFIEQYKAVDRSLSEWETLLARSLGVDRKAVSITIPKRSGPTAARVDQGGEHNTSTPGGRSKRLLDELSHKELKQILFQATVDFLVKQGYLVEKDPEARGWNTRRVTHVAAGTSCLVSIRTSQNGKIGYKRDSSDRYWEGLSDVDHVFIASLDHPKRPRFADIYGTSSLSLKDRLSYASNQRLKAGLEVKPGQTFWLSLYERPSSVKDYSNLGGGFANIRTVEVDPHPAGTRFPTRERNLVDLREYVLLSSADAVPAPDSEIITIAQAKKGVALSYDIPESEIEITINEGPTGRKR